MPAPEPRLSGLRGFFAAPLNDTLEALDRCLVDGGRGLLSVAAGLVAGWWIYVPLHELLHALACLAAGGEVSRLEVAPLYGGALLERVFPFVVAGGDYAGRLSGFDTHGNDAIYLLTDFGPYLLTIFPGVWALRRAGRRRRSLAFGFWLPFALAPFVSLTGDAYEIGSILVTRLPPWSTAEVLRSDDLLRLAPQLAELAAPPWGGAALGFLLGALWAFATYAAGRWLGEVLTRRSGKV